MDVMDTDQLETFELMIDRLEDAYELAKFANGIRTDYPPPDPGPTPFRTRYAETIDGVADLLRAMRENSHPMLDFLVQGYLHIQSAAGKYREQDADRWLEDARQCLAFEEVKTELFCADTKAAEDDQPDVLGVAEAAKYMRVSRDAVKAAFDRGDLQGRNVGQGKKRLQLRFTRGQIDSYLEDGSRPRRVPTQSLIKDKGVSDDLFPEF